MSGLKRSATSFRRQGSSGLVWEDRFLTADLNQMKKKEGVDLRDLRTYQSVGSIGMMERSHSTGGGGRGQHGSSTSSYLQTGNMTPAAADPPSPKVFACGFFGLFGKPRSTHRSKSAKRKSAS